MSFIPDMQDLTQMPALRKYPSASKYYQQANTKFLDILRQYSDDDPGIEIEGVYYPDENNMVVLGKVTQVSNDIQNTSKNFLKINDVMRELEKDVEKLVS